MAKRIPNVRSRRSFVLSLVLAAALAGAATRPAAQSHTADDGQVISWLRSQATPLAGTDIGRDQRDLQPFKQALGEAQVVGLGEATHGTREFFQFKHRLVQFLVTELGFTVIALEVGAADSEPLNDYVVHGTGTLEAVLTAQGYLAYDTEEFAALVEWLRIHNQRVPSVRRVRIVGLDIMTNTRGRARVLDYVREHAPQRVAETERLFQALAEEQEKTPLNFNRERLAALLPQIQALHAHLVAERTRLAGSDGAHLDALVRDMRHMAQWSVALKPDTDRERVSRSQAMGRNVLEIVSQTPGAKVIVWAANGHVGLRNPDGRASMGSEIGDKLGTAYYPIAFEFGRGTALVRPPEGQGKSGPYRHREVASLPAPALSWYLSQASTQDVFVDLRARRPAAVEAWLRRPLQKHGISWNQRPEDSTVRVDTVARYDGVVYFHVTTPNRPTASGRERAANGQGI